MIQTTCFERFKSGSTAFYLNLLCVGKKKKRFDLCRYAKYNDHMLRCSRTNEDKLMHKRIKVRIRQAGVSQKRQHGRMEV